MELSLSDCINPTNINIEALNTAISKISTGRAVLFTGSGFSFGCKNILGKQPPRAKELAKLISNLGDFEEDEDLSFVSDYYLNYKDKDNLLDLLKENFTIVSTESYHKKISSIKWKRIYTTNYDNSIEQSAKDVQKIIKPLTVEDDPKEYYKKKNSCIHINGSIESLSEKTLESKFKLTRSSYFSHDSFVNSPWYYYFKKDLEQCSAIIFIGYSLYDIDIEKLLFLSPTFQKKTYFIIGKEPTKKEFYILSKYGYVFPIGIDGFSEKIEKRDLSDETKDNKEFWLDCFQKYQLSDLDKSISDSDIMDFILYGNLDKKYIDNAISSHQLKPFLIVRECIDEVEKILNQNNFLAISGDFGNGKTILLYELMSHFSMLGKQVFHLQNPDGDFIQDVEKIHNLSRESLLVVDDYSLNLDILIHLSKFNSGKIKVIFADRTHNHDRLRRKLLAENIKSIELSIDILQRKEIEHFVSIIDNLGFWGKKAAHLSFERKVNIIATTDRKQISHTLINLFNSPQMKERISSLLSPIINDTKYKDTVFAICLLGISNLPQNISLISEVSGNDLIYKSELRNNSYFNQLFNIQEHKIVSKSSLFSLNLLNNHFSPSYITNKLLDIVEKYDSLKNNGTIEKELFKSFLRFSFIERLLPEKSKLNSLVKYYEELKIRVSWLKLDPHYWLQYGMARIAFGQYEKAQSDLDEAYGIIMNKPNYDDRYHDTQQARLYLLKSIDENDGNRIWNLFLKAHNLLLPLDDDTYKYRQVITYKRFFDQKYSSLSKKNKNAFVQAVNKMKINIEKSEYFYPDNLFSNYTLTSCHKFLSEIIEKTEN